MILYPHLETCFHVLSGIATETSVWDGVVVSPLDKAYFKPVNTKKDTEDEEMETEAATNE